MTLIPCKIFFRALLALGWGCALTAVVHAQTAGEIIAKARAYLGDEAALDAIRSVRYIGAIEAGQSAPEGDKPAPLTIDIIFQKPYQERITRTTATHIEVTALNNYDGWRRLQEVGNESNWRLTLLSKDQIKSLRANVFENLYFFKGIEERGGRVDVLGPASIDAGEAIKVAFIHEPRIVFNRYFDKATGRLLLTETSQGGRIREEGEMMVNGLRFPRRIILEYTARDEKGETIEREDVITFEKIILNEKFPAALFEVPALVPPASANSPAS